MTKQICGPWAEAARYAREQEGSPDIPARILANKPDDTPRLPG